MTSLKKTFVALLAAGTLAAATTSTPAAAHNWHHGFGGGIAAGILGGMVLGAIAANAASDDCGYVRQPVYDQWGHFHGYRTVPAC
jgi:hypothetical protein